MQQNKSTVADFLVTPHVIHYITHKQAKSGGRNSRGGEPRSRAGEGERTEWIWSAEEGHHTPAISRRQSEDVEEGGGRLRACDVAASGANTGIPRRRRPTTGYEASAAPLRSHREDWRQVEGFDADGFRGQRLSEEPQEKRLEDMVVEDCHVRVRVHADSDVDSTR